METACLSEELEFQELSKCKVVSKFIGGTINTDAGALLLREVESCKKGILQTFQVF